MSPVVRFVFVAVLPLAVAACGVPDLVAHGVKSYERSQDANGTAANASSANQAPASQAPAAQSSTVRRPPSSTPSSDNDFVPAPAPQRESITAEPLR